MNYIAALWQASPGLFLAGYAVIGFLVLSGIVRFIFSTPADAWEELKLALPGGRERMYTRLRSQITGEVDGKPTYHYEDTVEEYMQRYQAYVLLMWFLLIVPLFAWPLHLIILAVVTMLVLMFLLVIFMIEVSYAVEDMISEAWAKITKRH